MPQVSPTQNIHLQAALRGVLHDCYSPGTEEKLAELDAEIEQLRAALGVTEDQRKAIATVIGVYDPDGTEEFTPQGARSDRSTPARQFTNLLKGRGQAATAGRR